MPLAKAGKAFAALKLSQKTCLLSKRIGFFGLKNDRFLQNIRARYFNRTRLDEDPNRFCFFVALRRKSPAAGRINIIEYQSFQCQAEIFIRRGKRESGANPERSGHCKRGDGLQCHCAMHEKAQPMSMIREPGNLLKTLCIASGESDLPCGSFWILL